MPEDKQSKQAIKNISRILQGIQLKNPITQKEVSRFYTILESEFDESLDELEEVLLKESENKSKFEDIEELANKIKNDVGGE